MTARALVNQLQMEVDRLRLDLERENRKKKKKKKKKNPSNSSLSLSQLDRCSVCLCLPRAPLRVFQCPEGHVFCSECKARYITKAFHWSILLILSSHWSIHLPNTRL